MISREGRLYFILSLFYLVVHPLQITIIDITLLHFPKVALLPFGHVAVGVSRFGKCQPNVSFSF